MQSGTTVAARLNVRIRISKVLSARTLIEADDIFLLPLKWELLKITSVEFNFRRCYLIWKLTPRVLELQKLVDKVGYLEATTVESILKTDHVRETNQLEDSHNDSTVVIRALNDGCPTKNVNGNKCYHLNSNQDADNEQLLPASFHTKLSF